MKLTEKKIHELKEYLNGQMIDYQELIDAGFTEYYQKRYVIQDVLEFVDDLFDVEEVQDEEV